MQAYVAQVSLCQQWGAAWWRWRWWHSSDVTRRIHASIHAPHIVDSLMKANATSKLHPNLSDYACSQAAACAGDITCHHVCLFISLEAGSSEVAMSCALSATLNCLSLAHKAITAMGIKNKQSKLALGCAACNRKLIATNTITLEGSSADAVPNQI